MARIDLVDLAHSYGGITLHDVIHNRFAKKAIEKGADGLIAVASGAGGHAGSLSPFALVQEIRECHQQAVQCVQQPEAQNDAKVKKQFLELTRLWLLLAHGCESAAR